MHSVPIDGRLVHNRRINNMMMRRTGSFAALLVLALLASGFVGFPPQQRALAQQQPAATGQINGTVTAADDGAPLPDVDTTLYDASTLAPLASTTTSSLGSYQFTGLPGGSYLIEFEPAPFRDSRAYLGEYYDDQPSRLTASTIELQDAASRTADGVLALGGQISGTVTLQDADMPLEAVDVYVRRLDGTLAGWATTNQDGEYLTSGLPAGSYRVEFTPGAGVSEDYIGEFYPDRATLAAAVPVGVSMGEVTGNIDAGLVRGGSIQGRVTATEGGSPLDDVSVALFAATGQQLTTASVDSQGNYAIPGLPSGDYSLQFNPFMSDTSDARAYLSQSTSEPVQVIAPQATMADAALEQGGQIGGTVTASGTSTPLEGVTIYVWRSDQSYVGLTRTDSSGAYTTPGLSSGSYLVSFDTAFATGSARDYQDEVYDDQDMLDTAATVAVTAPALTPGIDAVLVQGATISGTVTAATTGTPLAGITIELYRDGNWTQSAVTDGQGSYVFRGLASGSYTLRAVPPFNRNVNYAPVYYNNQAQPEQATPVTVTAPQIVSGIDMVLQAGGTISGRVMALDTGNGLSTVAINIYDSRGELIRSASADEQGYYQTAGLADGAYRVQFVANDPANRYRGEYYADQPTLGQADPVQVVVPAETPAIDAVLAPQRVLFLPLLLR
jgi:hypothetical protein